MEAFPENAVWCQEYVGPGIERVYAARLYEWQVPVLLICRPDGSYVELDPSKTKLRSTTHDGRAGDVWQNIIVLQHATYIGTSWMHVRVGMASAG